MTTRRKTPNLAAAAAVAALLLLAAPGAVAEAPQPAAKADKADVQKGAPKDVPKDVQKDAQAKKPHLTATLMADVDAVTPGKTFRLGVRYQMDPKWHIYWIEPGEAGVPTKIHFDAPDGWDLGEVQWPAPTDFTTGSIKGIGYERDVILFTEVRVPDSALEGSTVKFAARTTWLVCEDSCIRGRANLVLSLPVQAEAGPGANKALFDKFAAQVPVAAPDGLSIAPLVNVDGVVPGTVWEVALPVSHSGGKAVEPVAFYASGAEGLEVKTVTVSTKGPGAPANGFIVRTAGKASEDATLRGDKLTGVLVAKIDGQTTRVVLDVKVPRLAEGKQVTYSDNALFTMKLDPAQAADAPGAAADGDGDEAALDDEDASLPADAALIGFWLAMLFGFIGGVILNGMPCVLPVLSIKILSIVEQSGDEPKRIRNHAWAYTAGIMVTFAVVAVIMLTLGRGLGALNQYVWFNAALGAVMLLFALSLFGVFEIVAPGANSMNSAIAKRHGYASSFVYGMFAVLLGTPCTAPFLAPAVGAALAFEPVYGFMIFMMTGVGLAFPFLLIGYVPQWSKLIPKPGPWMETFKKVMGFALIATAIWMVDIVSHQVSRDGLMGYIIFLGFAGLAAWIYGHWGNIMRSRGVRVVGTTVAVGVIVGAQLAFMGLEKPEPKAPALPPDQALTAAVSKPIVDKGEIQWRDFVDVDVEKLAAAGSTVFIDFTAAWCATCKVYEASVIDTDTIKDKLVAGNVIPVKADYTNEDPKITEWLKRFNRAGVPMYLIIPANKPDKVIKLPDHLTTERMLKGLKRAGPSQIQVTQAR